MISACVLIRTERGRFKEVTEKLGQVKAVKRAFPVLGRFDIIADIEAADGDELAYATLKVNRMSGVVFTETLPEIKPSK